MPGALCVVVAGALLSAAPADPIELHVMPRPAPGHEDELEASTITRALSVLDTLREGGNNSAARIVVHGGHYEIAEPFVIDAALVGEGLDIDAAEATALLAKHPKLMTQVLDVIDRGMPTLSAVIERRPASVAAVDLNAVNRLLDEVARVASPELRQVIRDLQRHLKEQGVEFLSEADESTTGPASFVVVDPDGNPILVDQHV